MRAFRFPRFVIVLMIACFVTVSGAILMAREVSRRVEMRHSSNPPNVLTLLWKQLPAMVITGFGTVCLFGAIGYGVLSVSGRTGRRRIAKLDTRAPQARR